MNWQPSYNTKEWHFLQMFGPAGWIFVHKCGLRVILSLGRFRRGQILKIDAISNEGDEWIHLSLSRKDRIPDWKDLSKVRADFLPPESYAYIVFPPVDKYVNIHKTCLHIYSRVDGAAELPDFHMEIGDVNSI